MNTQVSPVKFLLLRQTQTHHQLDAAVHQQTANQRHHHASQGSRQLRHQTDTTETTERLAAKDTGRDTTQTPSAWARIARVQPHHRK